MSLIDFTVTERAAAVSRGVRQCVLIGAGPALREVFKRSSAQDPRVFALDENPLPDSHASFVPTRFASETLATTLERSDFDKLKASLFVWLGGAGYRSADTVIGSLAFIASLPQGSGVVLDYAVERASLGSLTDTALDALASRFPAAGGSVKYLIQPQAVAAMLRSLGFRQIVDLAQEEVPVSGGHLVSALV